MVDDDFAVCRLGVGTPVRTQINHTARSVCQKDDMLYWARRTVLLLAMPCESFESIRQCTHTWHSIKPRLRLTLRYVNFSLHPSTACLDQTQQLDPPLYLLPSLRSLVSCFLSPAPRRSNLFRVLCSFPLLFTIPGTHVMPGYEDHIGVGTCGSKHGMRYDPASSGVCAKQHKEGTIA